ncbi:Uncharacterised protein [uncultured archaeon]|nr:Uncharacterised protein [uncultured archaeon]
MKQRITRTELVITAKPNGLVVRENVGRSVQTNRVNPIGAFGGSDSFTSPAGQTITLDASDQKFRDNLLKAANEFKKSSRPETICKKSY